MDSVLHAYPYQKDQTHYRPYYYPDGNRAVPPQMFMNPAQPPTGHGYWPCGSSSYGGYASLMPCHGFCNHSYWQPHYAWGSSPYSHVLQYHCPGSCHPYPRQFMHAPGCAVEPRYEYEKNVPGFHHCCGYPNHLLHPNEQKNVMRIKEAESDGERGRRKNDDSKPPLPFSNQPYPIMWLPSDCRGNQEGNKESFGHERANENPKFVDTEQPGFWNGWFPLDLNKLVSSKQTGHEERNDSKQDDDDAKGRRPYPVVWIPYRPDRVENEERKEDAPVAKPKLELEGSGDGQTSPRAKDIQVMKVVQHEDKEKPKNQDQEGNASVGGEVASSRTKDIPVKEMGQQEDKGVSKDQDNIVSAKDKKPKSSKLPPVCLRVDPLPRRKSVNGSSRSPSPPREKQKPKTTPSNEASKDLSSSVNKKPDHIQQNELKAGKGVTKNVEVVDWKTQQEESGNINKEVPVSIPVNSQEVQKSETLECLRDDNGTSCKHAEADGEVEKDRSGKAESAKTENQESVAVEEQSGDEAKELPSKRELSEEEAAVIVQSAYRGFEVRRWEPIKKLKQIAEVRGHIAEVEHLIKFMELSSSDAESKSKQRTVIGEIIMSLLLKLDTIQGLHLSIREIRKSVVRDLVSLQEKLDAMEIEKSEHVPGHEAVGRLEEDTLTKNEDISFSQNGNENSETPEVNPVGEAANAGAELATGRTELYMTKEAESASVPEPIIEADEKNNETHKNDKSSASASVPEPIIEAVEKNNEAHENDKSSILDEEVCEDHVLMQKLEVPPLISPSEDATDSTPTYADKESIVHESLSDLYSEQQDQLGQEYEKIATSESNLIGDEEASNKCTNKVVESCTTEETALKEDTNEVQLNDETLVTQESTNHEVMNADAHNDDGQAMNTAQVHNENYVADDMLNKVSGAVDANNLSLSGEQTSEQMLCSDGDSDLSGGHQNQLDHEQEKEAVKSCTTEEITSKADMNKEDKTSMSKMNQIETKSPADSTEFTPINAAGINASEGSELTNHTQGAADGLSSPENTKPMEVGADAQNETADMSHVILAAEAANNLSVCEEQLNLSPGLMEVAVDNPGNDQVDPIVNQEASVEVPSKVETQQAEEPNDKMHERVEVPSKTETQQAEEPNDKMHERVEATERNRRLEEENEKLREMVKEVMKSGAEQAAAMSTLLGRVKDLEKRLQLSRRRKAVKVRKGHEKRNSKISE